MEYVLAGLRGEYACYPMIIWSTLEILKNPLVRPIMALFYHSDGHSNHGENQRNLLGLRENRLVPLTVSAFHL